MISRMQARLMLTLAMVALGGKATPTEVYRFCRKRFPAAKADNFEYMIRWARVILTNQKFLKKNVVRGLWEIR